MKNCEVLISSDNGPQCGKVRNAKKWNLAPTTLKHCPCVTSSKCHEIFTATRVSSSTETNWFLCRKKSFSVSKFKTGSSRHISLIAELKLWMTKLSRQSNPDGSSSVLFCLATKKRGFIPQFGSSLKFENKEFSLFIWMVKIIHVKFSCERRSKKHHLCNAFLNYKIVWCFDILYFQWIMEIAQNPTFWCFI